MVIVTTRLLMSGYFSFLRIIKASISEQNWIQDFTLCSRKVAMSNHTKVKLVPSRYHFCVYLSNCFFVFPLCLFCSEMVFMEEEVRGVGGHLRITNSKILLLRPNTYFPILGESSVRNLQFRISCPPKYKISSSNSWRRTPESGWGRGPMTLLG